MWLSGAALVLLFFFLPETSSANILYRRTQRLKKLTGNDKLKCEPELIGEQMTPKEIVLMALVRPITLNFTEPMVFLLNLYIALVYGKDTAPQFTSVCLSVSLPIPSQVFSTSGLKVSPSSSPESTTSLWGSKGLHFLASSLASSWSSLRFSGISTSILSHSSMTRASSSPSYDCPRLLLEHFASLFVSSGSAGAPG